MSVSSCDHDEVKKQKKKAPFLLKALLSASICKLVWKPASAKYMLKNGSLGQYFFHSVELSTSPEVDMWRKRNWEVKTVRYCNMPRQRWTHFTHWKIKHEPKRIGTTQERGSIHKSNPTYIYMLALLERERFLRSIINYCWWSQGTITDSQIGIGCAYWDLLHIPTYSTSNVETFF